MTPIALPSREILLARLGYYPYTGALLWKPVDEIIMPGKGVAQRWNKLYADMEAFTSIDGEGYLYGQLSNTFYKAHRIIWKMQTDEEPDQIDHKDRNKLNNAWSNLRKSSAFGNATNRGMRSDNTSGFTGVTKTPSGSWMVKLGNQYLGTYKDLDEAINIRDQALSASSYDPSHGKPTS